MLKITLVLGALGLAIISRQGFAQTPASAPNPSPQTSSYSVPTEAHLKKANRNKKKSWWHKNQTAASESASIRK